MRFARYWLPALAWTAILLAASGETFSAGESGTVLSAILSMLHISLDGARFGVLHTLVRKCGHLLAYGLLGALFFRALRGARRGWTATWAITALVLTLAVAATDEGHQATTKTRTGTPADVLVDLTGAALALSLIRWRSAPASPSSPPNAA